MTASKIVLLSSTHPGLLLASCLLLLMVLKELGREKVKRLKINFIRQRTEGGREKYVYVCVYAVVVFMIGYKARIISMAKTTCYVRAYTTTEKCKGRKRSVPELELPIYI